MEISKYKNYVAPFFGLFIASPILALLIYFILTNEFDFDFLFGKLMSQYLTNTTILVIGTFFLVLIIGTTTSYLSAKFEYFGSKFFSI